MVKEDEEDQEQGKEESEEQGDEESDEGDQEQEESGEQDDGEEESEINFQDSSDVFQETNFNPQNFILSSDEVLPQVDLGLDALEDSLGEVFQSSGEKNEDGGRDYTPRADYDGKQDDDYEPKGSQRVELTETATLRDAGEIVNPFAHQAESRLGENFGMGEGRTEFEDFHKQQEKYAVEDEEKRGVHGERRRERGEII